MIAPVPYLYGCEQPHGFFLGALERPAIAVMRCGLVIRRLAKALVADQHAGRLRAAQALAAGVADQRRPFGEMDVGHQRLFRRGIDKDGHALLLADGTYCGDVERTLGLARRTHDIDHRRAWADSRTHLIRRLHLHQLGAHHADADIVGIARMFGDEDLVLALDVGQRLGLLDIRSGDAGDGRQNDRRFAAIGDDAPFRAVQRRQPRADAIHHLVQVDVIVRGLEHRLFDLRQRARAGDDGVGAARINERPDPDAGEAIVRLEARQLGQRDGGRRRRGRQGRHRQRAARGLEQVAPAPLAEQCHAHLPQI